MKYTHIIFAVLTSFFGLNAMELDTIQWEEIYKNPEKKQQLSIVYKDFCKKRFYKAIPLTVASWIPLSLWASYTFKQLDQLNKVPRLPSLIFGSLVSLFATKQTFSLARYRFRDDLARQGDLFYLKDDVNDIKKALFEKHKE